MTHFQVLHRQEALRRARKHGQAKEFFRLGPGDWLSLGAYVLHHWDGHWLYYKE